MENDNIWNTLNSNLNNFRSKSENYFIGKDERRNIQNHTHIHDMSVAYQV